MKRIRFALLSMLTISLLMNFPDWFSGWNSSIVTTRVAARPFFVPERAEFVGVIFEDGFESGDVSAWSFSKPSELLDQQSVNGLQPGEKITAVEAIPPPPGLNSTTEDGDDFRISAISNIGRLYNYDCVTATFVFLGLLELLQNNQRLSYTFNSGTGVGLVLDPDAGMQMAINPYTGQVLGSGPINFFYPPGDPNFGTNPNVIGWGTSTTDYDNDGDVDILFYDQGTDCLGEIGGDGSLNTLFSLGLPEGTHFTDMDTPGITFGDIDNDGNIDLFVLGQGMNDPPVPSLFSVDLNTGQTTDLGTIGDGTEEIKTWLMYIFSAQQPIEQ